MAKEELKEKYSNFIADVSEILGLGKPIDILKLCQVTDRFFRPLQNSVTDLEKENAELKNRDCWKSCEYANPKSELIAQHIKDVQQLTKAKELLNEFLDFESSCMERGIYISDKIRAEAEQFLKEDI